MNLDTLLSGRRRIQTLFAGQDPRPLALLYLAALTLAEVLTVFSVVQVGLALHLALLFLIMLHAAALWSRRRGRFLVALALVPLIRVVSLSLPLAGFPLVYWYLITSLPLFAAALVVMRLLGLPWRDLGFTARGLPSWLLQLLVGLTGLGLGLVEYFILRPEPLVETFTLQALWLPALILLLSTGYLEELIFRHIMQRAAVELLGRGRGILYAALFFAVLHIGYKSLPDVLFVFAVGLAFGWFVFRTGSLVGVSLSHGLTNVVLFLVAPFWLAEAQAPLVPAAGAPAAEPPVPATAIAPAVGAAAGATPSPTAAPLLLTPTAGAGAPAASPSPMVTTAATPTSDGGTVTRTATPSATLSYTATASTAASPGGIVEHVVQPGQYVRRLAREYGTTMEAIQELNDLGPEDVIHPGDRLLIPAGTTPTPTASVPAATAYVVQRGDTVFSLARRFNTTVEAIVAANNLKDAWRIYAGQTLHIPAASSPAPAPS